MSQNSIPEEVLKKIELIRRNLLLSPIPAEKTLVIALAQAFVFIEKKGLNDEWVKFNSITPENPPTTGEKS
ncbi:MAG: hypothetical protein HS129_15200 [Leptospiraceae bacterium]|nr:hypothetical protein [Leptospiraceae bacterium]